MYFDSNKFYYWVINQNNESVTNVHLRLGNILLAPWKKTYQNAILTFTPHSKINNYTIRSNLNVAFVKDLATIRYRLLHPKLEYPIEDPIVRGLCSPHITGNPRCKLKRMLSSDLL